MLTTAIHGNNNTMYKYYIATENQQKKHVNKTILFINSYKKKNSQRNNIQGTFNELIMKKFKLLIGFIKIITFCFLSQFSISVFLIYFCINKFVIYN